MLGRTTAIAVFSAAAQVGLSAKFIE